MTPANDDGTDQADDLEAFQALALEIGPVLDQLEAASEIDAEELRSLRDQAECVVRELVSELL